jgi:hypothetical protein
MGTSNRPALGRCDFEVRAVAAAFRRGDFNDDGSVDVSDPVSILGCKFLGLPCARCRDAGDANDDGELDISDAVSLLSFLFLGGVAPRAPGPQTCGSDPTADALPACEYTSCS